MELSEKLWRETPKSDCTCCFLVMTIAAAAATMVVVIVVMLMKCRRWDDDGGIDGFHPLLHLIFDDDAIDVCVCVCLSMCVKYIAWSLITFIFYFIDGLTVSGPVYYSYTNVVLHFACVSTHTHMINTATYLSSTQHFYFLSLSFTLSISHQMDDDKKRCPKRVFKVYGKHEYS